MTEIIGRYTTVGPYRIYYESAGEGRSVICFPTAGATATEYHYVLPVLAKHGYRAIAVDPPGHAHSFPDFKDLSMPTTQEEYVEFAWEFSQAIGAAEQSPIFLGCAMTGSMMFALGAKYGDRIGAIVAAEGNSVFRMDMLLLMLNHPGVNHADFMQIVTPNLSSAELSEERLNECIWHNGRGTNAEAYQAELTIYDNLHVQDLLQSISCPVLHLYGGEDSSVSEESAKEIRKKVPELRQVCIPNMGHIAPIDQPEAFGEEVLKFLKEYDL